MKPVEPFPAYEIRHNPTSGTGFRLEIVAVTVREMDRAAGAAMVENRVGGYVLRHLAKFDRLASTPARAAKIALAIARSVRLAADAAPGEAMPRRKSDPADVFRFRVPSAASSGAENPPSPNGQENAAGARLVSAVLSNLTR